MRILKRKSPFRYNPAGFNNVNQHYSWIVAGNQKGYDEHQLRNAKVSMDNMFYVDFTKPHDKNTLPQFICSVFYLSYLPLLPHVICLS